MPERRPLLDAVIVVLLVMMLGSGLPQWIPGVPWLERRVDVLTDLTGVQQSNWMLFAPNPDRMNAWIEATVEYSDGTVRMVGSPDWRSRTLLQKLVQGRYPKIVDYARRDDWQQLWRPWAQHALAQLPSPPEGVRVDRVRLTRHWWTVPPPDRIHKARARFGELPPPRDQYPGRHEYYVWELTE